MKAEKEREDMLKKYECIRKSFILHSEAFVKKFQQQTITHFLHDLFSLHHYLHGLGFGNKSKDDSIIFIPGIVDLIIGRPSA